MEFPKLGGTNLKNHRNSRRWGSTLKSPETENLGGGGGQTGKKTSVGGMDIFWNHTMCHLACSRLSVVGDERKGARKKNEGGLSQGVAWEPVRISLTTLFWCSRSCYTLWLVNFDSTVNTPAVASYLVNQKDHERGLRKRLRGIRIDFHLRQLSAGIPEYSSAKEGAATMSSKSCSWERHFRYSSNRFWEKFNFSALPTTC